MTDDTNIRISFSLPITMLAEIDELAKKHEGNRSLVIRKLLRRSLPKPPVIDAEPEKEPPDQT